MNRIIAAIMTVCIAIAVAPCASAKPEKLIDIDLKFSPDAYISEDPGPEFRHQVGETNGVRFAFYEDGGGNFGKINGSPGRGWQSICRRDKMTDDRRCFLIQGGLSVTVDRSNSFSVNIGHNHYPGTNVMLRLDSEKPMSAGENGWIGVDAGKIVKKILASKKVATRFTKWPNKVPSDEEFDPHGLDVAIEYARWVINGQKMTK